MPVHNIRISLLHAFVSLLSASFGFYRLRLLFLVFLVFSNVVAGFVCCSLRICGHGGSAIPNDSGGIKSDLKNSQILERLPRWRW